MELDRNKDWLRNIRRIKSPNCDDRPDNTVVNLLVIHGISLPPGQYGGDHIDRLFTNSLEPDRHPYFREIGHLRVSSHLLIDRKGRVTQYVPFGKRAWHAGESEYQGCRACNDFSIGIELEGCDDEKYQAAQYTRLAEITRLLINELPGLSRDRIVGHCDIAPGRKTDPGAEFDWDHFHNLIE